MTVPGLAARAAAANTPPNGTVPGVPVTFGTKPGPRRG